MAFDWLLASLHHLAILTLAAVLAFELALTGGAVEAGPMTRLARIDALFGAAAAVALGAGLLRVFLGARGVGYYGGNSLFWIKMALFALAALLSTVPSYHYLLWRRETARDPAFRPGLAALRAVRRALWSEAALFGLIAICAAGMARGFGA